MKSLQKMDPLSFRERENFKLGLKELGPVAQNDADVLEQERQNVQIQFG